MTKFYSQIAIALAAGFALVAGGAGSDAAAGPKRGGILKYIIPSNPPSADAHRESTFGTIHPFAQFYSVLLRINPSNPASTTDFRCDLCVGDVPKPTDGGLKYTFKIKKGVKWHRVNVTKKTPAETKKWSKAIGGTELNAHDLVATYKKLIDPPKGVISNRKAFFSMVESVTAPDDFTLVFKLKYPSGAFIPALALPYNFVYAKKILDTDMHWYEKYVLGTGPFKFVEWQTGSHIKAERNEAYYHKGQPYLDGTEAVFAKKYSINMQAIRGGRAYIQFRGFPPKMRDDLVKALGKKLTVQESDWNCALFMTPNNKVKPFDDVRVRRALSLAIDRWGGSKYLSKIAIVKTVGGIVFPGHPLAATKKELEQIAGYWPDIEKSRAEARRLLKEAGYPNGVSFTLHNRATDQPYKILGAWLIGQWQKVGFKVEHWVQTTKPFLSTLQIEKDFEVSLHGYCGSVINPLLDVARLTSDDRSATNYGNYRDRVLDRLFDEMNRSADPAARRRIMRKFEKRALDDQAHQLPILWWRRIVPHRSIVRGWKISPSHYINQDLGNVWLAE